MSKLLNKTIELIFAVLFFLFWHLQRLIPRDKHIFVFGSWRGRNYSDNTKALYEYILKNEPILKPYWITRNKNLYKKLLDEKKPVVMAYSLKGWWISLHASVTFTCIDLNDINKYALNGAQHIWLWHGMPLKKVRGNIDNNRYNFKGRRLNSKMIYTIVEKYLMPYNYFKKIVFATICSGNFFLKILESAFFLPENKVWTTGLPRTDYYFENKTEKIIDNIRKKYVNSSIFLYMPTFRDPVMRKGIPYNPFEDKSFNSELFLNFLNNEDIVFLYKAHLHDSANDYSLSSDRFLLINDGDYNELYTLVSNIDILITDYSSIYFDFLCLNKPVILTPFDYDMYIKESRELNFDYNLLPSIKAYNWDELMNIIAEKKYYSIPKEEADKFCKYNDGHASERVLQKTLELLDKSA